MVLVQLACAPRTSAQFPMNTRTQTERLDNAAEITAVCTSPRGGSLSIGSGVVIGADRVLTAWHVAGDCKDTLVVYVRTRTWRRQATLSKSWPQRDVVLLKMQQALDTVRPVSVAQVNAGDAVCTAVATPQLGSNCGTLIRKFETICPNNTWCNNIAFSALVIQGNSGGGIYDARGALVGLVTGGAFLPGSSIQIGDAFGSELWPIHTELFN